MKYSLSNATLSHSVSQLVEKQKLNEAYKLLPEANAIPNCINRLQKAFSAIEQHYAELHGLLGEVREELEQDWSKEEVRSFLAGAWQGMRQAADNQAYKALEAIYL